MNRRLILLAMLFAASCKSAEEFVFRIILPDGYIDWIRVDFGVDAAPPMKWDHPVIEVGDDGKFRTSSARVISTVEKYEFLYRSKNSLRAVPAEIVVNKFDAGGIGARADDYQQKIKPFSWYFFIGPSSYRAGHPNSSFSFDSLPTPGRMPPGSY